jgi:hypothetical protein
MFRQHAMSPVHGLARPTRNRLVRTVFVSLGAWLGILAVGAASAAAQPSVTWVSTLPPNTTAGQSYSMTWNVANGSPTHTNLHWDTSNPQNCSPSANPPCSTNAMSGGPGNYSDSFLAPNVSSPTTYYIAAHAIVNGVNYWSPWVATTVNPAATPSVTWVSTVPASTTAGQSYSATWNIANGSPTHTNLHWDLSNPQNCSPSANPPCSVGGGDKERQDGREDAVCLSIQSSR